MKKVIVTIAISALMALCLAGCGSSDESSPSSSSASSEAVAASDAAEASADATAEPEVPASLGTATASAGDTYEGFVEEYTYRMELETPILIDEYNSQSAGLSAQEKVDLCSEKIRELEKIVTEGTEKMAALMRQNGDDASAYEEYVNQLDEAYRTQADLINEAYLASV